MKTIRITDDIHHCLVMIKINEGHSSISDVLRKLLLKEIKRQQRLIYEKAIDNGRDK